MRYILYLKASPRGPRSHSVAVADAFLETLLEKRAEAVVRTRGLCEADLPPFDGPTLQAKCNVLHGRTHDPAHFKAWEAVKGYVDELKACSMLVMAVPMWNFSLPYRLKHYIDLIVQPGLSFGVNDDGAFGLIEDRPVFIAYASGGQYPPGSASQVMDHQRPYLEMILNYVGLFDIRSVRMEATLAGEATVAGRRTEAVAKARELAAAL